ncbi:MAG: hypothetical protein EZS28_001730 [Streblomastix strix]|uniref:Uncharacterized protein n=1 Tax=Streblomastix strix TaxID=222440 RepID=A0A5J4X887_9EUKA|nr:MAG: hypothetical protein EZS28_001730 [Streblomastix strix]
MLIGIISDKEHVYQEGCKIIHTDKFELSTVAFDPIISSGIVRFEGFFKDHPKWFCIIGITDSSAVFGSKEWPFLVGNVEQQIESEGGNVEIVSFVVYINLIKVNAALRLPQNPKGGNILMW